MARELKVRLNSATIYHPVVRRRAVLETKIVLTDLGVLMVKIGLITAIGITLSLFTVNAL